MVTWLSYLDKAYLILSQPYLIYTHYLYLILQALLAIARTSVAVHGQAIASWSLGLGYDLSGARAQGMISFHDIIVLLSVYSYLLHSSYRSI